MSQKRLQFWSLFCIHTILIGLEFNKSELEYADKYLDKLKEVNLHEALKEMADEQGNLYELKQKVLNNFGQNIKGLHRFNDETARNLYEIGGFTFHGEDISNTLSQEEFDKLELLENISSENKLTGDEKISVDEAIDILNNYEENFDVVYYQGAKNANLSFKSFEELQEAFKNYIEEAPEDYKINNLEKALKDLGITKDKPKEVKTPYETIQVRARNIEHIINSEGDKSRYKSINRMFATLERPNIITINEQGKRAYFKIFAGNNKTKRQITYVSTDEQGNFVLTTIPVKKESWFLKQINNGKIVFDRRKGVINNSPVNNSITNPTKNFKPKENFKTKESLVEKFILKPRIDKIILGESKWGKFYTDWVDRLTPIENLVKAAKERTSVPFAKNPYL